MNKVFNIKGTENAKMATIRIKQSTYDKWEKIAIKRTNEQAKIVPVSLVINEYLEKEVERLVKKYGLDVD